MTRQQLIEDLITYAKRWYPSVRVKAQHARMPKIELDLWKTIRALMEYDDQKR